MTPPRRSKSMDGTNASASSASISVSGAKELENTAEAFEEKMLNEEGLAREKPQSKRRMSLNLNLGSFHSASSHASNINSKVKVFSGRDAVSTLQTLLQCDTREEALQVGNQIKQCFDLFQHKDSRSPLHDSPSDLYHFHCNLPRQVRRMKNQYKSYWDKAKLIEDHVQVKDRRHMLDVFPNCFVAKEAVDVIVQLKLVKNRKEAVHLMKKLNQKVFFCEHVYQQHEFKDENLWFTFIPHNERMREPSQRTVCSKSLGQSLARINTCKPATKKTHRLQDIKKRLSTIQLPQRTVQITAKEGPFQPLPTPIPETKSFSWKRRVSVTGRAA